jgi:hypothetical protein
MLWMPTTLVPATTAPGAATTAIQNAPGTQIDLIPQERYRAQHGPCRAFGCCYPGQLHRGTPRWARRTYEILMVRWSVTGMKPGPDRVA